MPSKMYRMILTVVAAAWLTGPATFAQTDGFRGEPRPPEDTRPALSPEDVYQMAQDRKSALPPASDPDIEAARQAFGRGSAASPSGLTQHDYLAPTILHTPVERLKKFTDLTFRAVVTDNNPGVTVTLFYRPAGLDSPYFTAVMERGDGDNYELILPAAEVRDSPLHYYIMAEDANGNKNYTLVNIDRPHLIRLREGNAAATVVVVIIVSIVCAVGGIWFFRRYQSRSESRRADEIKKFIARQKQLKKESKKAFKRNIQRMHSARRSAVGRDEGVDIEEDSSDEVDTVASSPTKSETKQRSKTVDGRATTRQSATPGRRNSQAAAPASSPPPSPPKSAASRGEKIDDLLRRLDEKLAGKEPANSDRFNLKSEADQLLDDDGLFGQTKPKTPIKGSGPQPPKTRVEWESIDRTLEDLFGKGDLSDHDGK